MNSMVLVPAADAVAFNNLKQALKSGELQLMKNGRRVLIGKDGTPLQGTGEYLDLSGISMRDPFEA